MIKKIERSTIELADKLAKLEESLFGTAWDSFVINNKINNGEFDIGFLNKTIKLLDTLQFKKRFLIFTF